MKIQIKKVVLVATIVLILVYSSLAATRVFYVDETEFVKVLPESFDPDRDDIVYYFTEPLDENGEWQTGFDDAGEYTVTITASDGRAADKENITIIVRDRNQEPFVTESSITVKETQTVDITEFVEDPNEDPLEFEFNTPIDDDGIWTPGFEDSGKHIIEFKMNDGEFDVDGRIQVTVLDTNQPPIITGVFEEGDEIDENEGETIRFWVEAQDRDGSDVTYQWEFDEEVISSKQEGEYELSFDQEGEHVLKLIVSDGESSTSKEWNVNVENTNRPPKVFVGSVEVNEGEKVFFTLPETDEDGDTIFYTFSEPFNSNGEWQTGFEDEGTHFVKVTASDGELESRFDVEITVIDMNRRPILNVPKQLDVWEGGELEWEIDASDPDNDRLTISIDDLPEDADLDDEDFSWAPSYDEIRRSGGFWSNFLNTLRVEHFFLRTKEYPLTVKACDVEFCEIGVTKLVVHNVNREPIIQPQNVSVVEGQEIMLEPAAYDPDGDIIKYRYAEPFGRKGVWKTDLEDEGEHYVSVVAEDGSSISEAIFRIDVEKQNRLPHLEVMSDEITLNEKEQVSFKVEASDPDNDDLIVVVEDLPAGASFKEGVFTWEPSHFEVVNRTDSVWQNFVSSNDFLNRKFNDERESKWVEFSVTDGIDNVTHPVRFEVVNVNQAPTVLDYSPTKEVNGKVGEPMLFHVVGEDLDGDDLEYTWKFSMHEARVKGTDTIERVFKSAGRKTIEVEISDGRDAVVHEFIVNVAPGKTKKATQKVVQVVSQPPIQQDPYSLRVTSVGDLGYHTTNN